MKSVAEKSQKSIWLKECEICDAGLCVRMDALKSEGRTQREAARIMESEAEEQIGRAVWTASQIRDRYRWHTGKRKSGGESPTQSQQDQPLTTSVINNLDSFAETGQKFGTIYTDPPWPYQNQATRSATSGVYKPGAWQMSLEELAGLPIKQLAAEKAHLHLWTTNAFLFDAKDILEAWGFTYKSCFVWVKPKMGIGNYWRVSHEFLLLGVRGGLTFKDRAQMSWLQIKSKGHSQKPEQIAEIIEKVSPGPYLELFARRTRENWTVWGNEIERTLFNEAAFKEINSNEAGSEMQ